MALWWERLPLTQIPCAAEGGLPPCGLPGVWLSITHEEIPSTRTPRGLFLCLPRSRWSGCKELLFGLLPWEQWGLVSQAGLWFGFSSIRKSLLIASSIWSDALTLPTSRGHSSHPLSVGRLLQTLALPNLFLFFLPAAQLLPTAAKNLPREPGGQSPVLALRPAHGDLQPSDHLRYQQPSAVPPQSSSVWPSCGPVFTSGLPPHPARPDQQQHPAPTPGCCIGHGSPRR